MPYFLGGSPNPNPAPYSYIPRVIPFFIFRISLQNIYKSGVDGVINFFVTCFYVERGRGSKKSPVAHWIKRWPADLAVMGPSLKARIFPVVNGVQ